MIDTDQDYVDSDETAQRREDILSLLADWTWEIGSDFKITEIAGRFTEILGLKTRDFIGKKIDILVSPDELIQGDLSGLFRQPFRDFTIGIDDENGVTRHFSMSGTPMFESGSGHFSGAHGVAVDITAKLNAEITLQESEARYRILIETSPTAIVVHRNFVVKFANKSAQILFGANSETELLGKTSLELSHPDYQDIINNRREEVEQNVRPLEPVKILHLKLNGESFYTTDIAAPVIWDGENSVLVTMSDLSKIEAAESALAESEQRFRDFAESAADIFWETDENHRYKFVTPPVSELEDFDFDYVKGKKRWELEILDRDNEAWSRHQADMEAHRPFKSFRYSTYDANGRLRYFSSSGRPVFGEDGIFQGFRGTTVDETAESLARQSAENLHNRFFTAIENISEGFAMWDAQERFLFCNSFFRDSHPEGQEFLAPGKKYADFIRCLGLHGKRPGSKELIESWIEERLESFRKPSSVHEDRLGDTWMQVRKHKLDDGSTIVLFADITESKKREERLKASEDRIRLITDTIPALVAYNDKNLKFQFANKYFETIGLKPDEVIGKTYSEIFGDEIFQRIKPYTDRAYDGEIVIYENQLPSKDGGVIDTQVTITPDFGDDGDVIGLFVLSMDITILKKTTDLLRSNQIRLDNAQRIANIGSWERDLLDNSITWSNENFRIFGFDTENDHPTYLDFYETVHPEDREKHIRIMDECMQNRETRFSNDFRIVRKDGTERVIKGEGEITYDDRNEQSKFLELPRI